MLKNMHVSKGQDLCGELPFICIFLLCLKSEDLHRGLVYPEVNSTTCKVANKKGKVM